jgi:hypothetical protein
MHGWVKERQNTLGTPIARFEVRMPSDSTNRPGENAEVVKLDRYKETNSSPGDGQTLREDPERRDLPPDGKSAHEVEAPSRQFQRQQIDGKLQLVWTGSGSPPKLEADFVSYFNSVAKEAELPVGNSEEVLDFIEFAQREFTHDLEFLTSAFLNNTLPLPEISHQTRGFANVLRERKHTAERLVRAEREIVLLKDRGPGEIASIEFRLDRARLTEAQLSLVSDIQKAATVLQVVAERNMRAHDLRWRRRQFLDAVRARLAFWRSGEETFATGNVIRENVRQVETLSLRNAMLRLVEIARIGLGDPEYGPQVSRVLFEGFKDEIVSKEAEAVKNTYIMQLGARAFLAASFFFAAQFVIPFSHDIWNYFPLMLCGACIGAWLSFSIRKVDIGFADLAVLESDRLLPTTRVLFILCLTVVLGLFIQASIFSVSLGTLALKPDSAVMALAIGCMCGLAERALASSVAKRSESVIASIGGHPVEMLPSRSEPR